MRKAEQPPVSIVTVVLNNREGLRCTEESISCQTSREYEWVVVDGGSEDGSLELVQSSEIERVRHMVEPDQGIYDAMNKGIRMCSGEYVLFLNSGDRLTDNRVIENLVQVIGRLQADDRPKPIIAGGANLAFPRGHTIYKAPRPASYIWHSLPAYHQAMLFPVDFLRRNAYDISYRICGDYYLGALAHSLGREFVPVDYPISYFEVGGFSYQHPFKQTREAMRVQRTVLKLEPYLVLLSALKRMLNILGARALKVLPFPGSRGSARDRYLLQLWRLFRFRRG